jgi:hypothetical protein
VEKISSNFSNKGKIFANVGAFDQHLKENIVGQKTQQWQIKHKINHHPQATSYICSIKLFNGLQYSTQLFNYA